LITPINYFSCALKTFWHAGGSLDIVIGGHDFPDFLGRNISSLNHPAREASQPSPDGVGS
jgi:hypothetical protein